MSLPHMVSNEVEISPRVSEGTFAYFNRGLISTQRVSRALKGKPNPGSLKALIGDPQNKLRASLSGDMVEALTGFVGRAEKSGRIYAALYELKDPELVAALEKIGKVIRDRIQLFGMVQALTAEGRLSGWVLLILPVIVFLVSLVVNPEYARVLLDTPPGRIMLGAAIAMDLMGLAMIKKIVNIKV